MIAFFSGGASMTSDAGSGKNEMGLNTFVIYEERENKINVRANERFVIMIGSNITTGYNWSPANADGNEYVEFLGLGEDDCFGKKESLRGEPALECFIFKALKPGNTCIILNYSRPWENKNPPLKTVKISLSIQ